MWLLTQYKHFLNKVELNTIAAITLADTAQIERMQYYLDIIIISLE